MPGSTGTYNMSEANPENPSDLHANTEFIGKSGGGEFTQSGGHHGAETLYIGYQPGSTGTYTISGGNFDTYDFYIGTGGSGTFAITNAAAVVYVMNLLHFGPDSTFTAVPGSTIHMCGSTFENESIDPTVTGLAGLGNLNLVFGGGTEDVDPVEVAGQDKGAVAAGWTDNFALATLTLGMGFEMTEGKIQLVDDFDNQDDGAGNEAMYVNNLIMNAGATIDTNGLNLYYLNGEDPKQFFCGDANLNGAVTGADYTIYALNYNQAGNWCDGDFNGDGVVTGADYTIYALNYTGSPVPEPASATILLLGAIAVFRRRKK